jgi:hypothetical protein
VRVYCSCLTGEEPEEREYDWDAFQDQINECWSDESIGGIHDRWEVD